MWTHKNLLYIASALLMIVCNAAAGGEVTTIDVYRAKYIKTEQDLWRKTETIENKVDSLKLIFETHRNFNAEFLNNASHLVDSNEFIVLDRLYEWKEVQRDLILINSIFDVFTTLLGKFKDTFDELETNDFILTVIYDRDVAVDKTLESIENIMVKQALYYKVMLVGIILCNIFYFLERLFIKKNHCFVCFKTCSSTFYRIKNCTLKHFSISFPSMKSTFSSLA